MSTRADLWCLRVVVVVVAVTAALIVGLVAGTMIGDGLTWLYDRFDPRDTAVWLSALVLLAGAAGGTTWAVRERMRICDSDT